MPARVSRRAALAAGLSASVALSGCKRRNPEEDRPEEGGAGEPPAWASKVMLPKKPDPLATPERPQQPTPPPLGGASWEVKSEQTARVLVLDANGVACWVQTDLLVSLANAVAFYTQALRENEQDIYAYNFRGWAHHLLGRSADAVKDFDELLARTPQADNADARERRAVGLSNRGLVLAEMGRFDDALRDLNEAIDLDHQPARINRGWAYHLFGDYRRAGDDYVTVAEKDPLDAASRNNLGWLIATCPDATVRRMVRMHDVLKMQMSLCTRTGNREGMYLDTLAAACAEAGEFSTAVEIQELALADNGYVRKYGTEAQERLQLYKDKKPFRTAPPKP